MVAFIALDAMKRINDEFDHQVGSRAPVEAAERFRDSFRHTDILGPPGRNEFVVLIVEAGKDSIETMSRRVEQKLASGNAVLGRRYDLSFGVGAVLGDSTKVANIENLSSQADAAMFQQKQSKGAARTLAMPDQKYL